MSKRTVAVLGVITALLLGYVLLFERDGVTSKELAERRSRVLPSFVRDKVERLEIERRGVRVVLERKPASEGELRSFTMIAPEQADADADAVDRVLGELEWLTARRTLEPLSAEDAQRFGLDKPRYRVAYTLGRERHVLELGVEDVHGESVYARVDREPRALVVPNSVVEVLNHEPGGFREKQLLRELTVAWARKVKISSDARAIDLQKQADRWWLYESPRGFADAARVEELLRSLAELRATRYVETAQKQAATADLERPRARVTVAVVPEETREDKTAKELSLAVGGPCAGHAQERYARVLPDGPPVCIRDSDALRIDPTPGAFRDLRLFAAEPTAVTRIELANGERRTVLARGERDWAFIAAEPDAGAGAATNDPGNDAGVNGPPPSREAVEAWLGELARARALRVRPTTTLAEAGSLALTSVGDKPERFAFSPLAGGDLGVRRGEEPLSLAFSPRVQALLTIAPDRFRTLAIWQGRQPSEVQRIEARRGTEARTLALEAGAWRSVGKGAPPADSDRVRVLVRALLDLKALVYVSAGPLPFQEFGSGASLRLTLSDGTTLSLELGGPTEQGAYARVDARHVVELPRPSLALFDELAGGPRADLDEPKPAAPPPAEHDDHDHAH